VATEVASLYARIGADLSGFHRGMGQFNSAIGSAGGMFRNFTTGIVQGIGQAFGISTIRIVREFGDAVTGVIASAAGMEQGIADIRAVMGLTADETQKVGKLINDLGIDPKLKVTATEAANAVEMLGKSGLNLDQILGGAARSTVLLANSTGSDFATAADIATSAMAQFKIDAQDMAGAVDQITGVTRNSKFDINDYRLAISMAGGVAGAVGMEFADFNAVIAGIAPLFSSGSDAGTSFKTFLQRLVPQSQEAADAMREIGLFSGLTGSEFREVARKLEDVNRKIAALDPTSKNFTERMTELKLKAIALTKEMVAGGSAFFEQNGEMKSAADISQALNNAFGELSEAQKIQYATTIFGTDAMRAAFGLAELGTDQINSLKTAIGNTSAEESAAIRMDTLSGAWEIFRGIVESLTIQFGTAFLPGFRDVVAMLTDLATNIGPQVVTWGQQMGERFKAVTTAAVELMSLGLDKGFAAIFVQFEDGSRHLDKLFEAFGLAEQEAQQASQQFIDTATTIKDMALAVVALIKAVGDIVGPLVTFTNNTVGLENALKAVGVVMAASFAASIVSTITTIVSAVGSIATFVASLTGLGSVATAIGSAVVAAISAIGLPITLIVAAIGALALAWSQNWWDIQGKTQAAWEAIKSYSAAGWEATKGFFTGGWDYLKQVTGDGWEWTKRAFADGWEATKRNTTSGWDATKQAFASGWEWTKRTTTDGCQARHSRGLGIHKTWQQ
jgi:TP901 family phage tail tape measure protein